jgi:hypothetical protein
MFKPAFLLSTASTEFLENGELMVFREKEEIVNYP